MSLRPYQSEFFDRIVEAWAGGARNVIGTMATGGGKGVVVGHAVLQADCPARIIAHRGELVGQLSLALNRENVPHAIDAPAAVISEVCKLHHRRHGYSRYRPRSQVRVASVQTLANRGEEAADAERVGLVIVDEAHHVTKGSVWDKAVHLYANARVLGLTAHALRGDHKGLGRGAHGIFDTLVQGAYFRELIDQGYLCDYRPIVADGGVDFSNVPVGATGDYNHKKLCAATMASKHIVGDAVEHYRKFASGMLGVNFCVSVDAAGELQRAYSKAHVRAEILTGETPTHVRAKLIERFEARDILVLLSIDVLSEGVDIPAVEFVTMSRGTASLQVFAQQTGRGSRVSVGKEWAPVWDSIGPEARKAAIASSSKPKFILIDQVRNIQTHGLPCVPRRYNLDTRERAKKKDECEVQIRVCLNADCLLPYPRELDACPQCGTAKPLPVARTSPEVVEGNLLELDPTVLAGMREAAMRALDLPRLPVHAGPAAVAGCKARHGEKVEAIVALQETMALWAGWQRVLGRSDAESMRAFWLRFGVDVLSAQDVTRAAAEDLRERVQSDLDSNGVIRA